MEEQQDRSFEDWMKEVDLDIGMKYPGATHKDLNDYPWKQEYDDGATPGEAVHMYFIMQDVG